MFNQEEIKKILAEKIRNKRENLKYTQEELANLADLGSVQKVSKIEKGEQNIKADELIRIAKVLYFDLNELFETENKPQNIFLWRQEPKEADDKEKIKADFLNYCKNYSKVEHWVGINCNYDWNKFIEKPEDLSNNYKNKQYAMALAKLIHSKYDLGGKPAFYIKDLLEDQLCIKLCYKDLKNYYGNKNIDGSAFCSIGEYGPGILINSTDVDSRINFSLAHELFHLLTWNVIDPAQISNDSTLNNNIESMANYFASELLMPESSLKIEFDSSIDQNSSNFYLYLAELARKYFVSYVALAYRLKNLNLLTNEVQTILDEYKQNYSIYRSIIKQQSTIYHKKFSERFLNLLLTAYQLEKISLGRISEITGLGIKTLEEILECISESDGDQSYEMQTGTT